MRKSITEMTRTKSSERVTYESTTKFIEHPMLRRIEPLHVLLQTPRL